MSVLARLQGCRIVDSTVRPDAFLNKIVYPYAWDEVMCRKMETDSAPLLHIWSHPKALVLGLRDRRLPHAKEAMEQFAQEDYDVAVRNSGGAIVPLDSGVINLALLFPAPKRIVSFRDDFQLMAELIRQSLAGWTDQMRVGEIHGSYCPGDYDLSINGKKFCGIAQRRLAKAFVLQAFINVEGSGEQRGMIAKRFYELAATDDYLLVEPSNMASLSELTDGIVSVQAFVNAVKEIVNTVRMKDKDDARKEGVRPIPLDLFPLDEIQQTAASLKERYDKS